MLPIRRLALSQRSAFLLRPTASLVARRTYAEGSFQDLKARILDQEPSNAGHPGPLRPRPARDDMSADEAEQAQEDLTDTAMNGRYPNPQELAETSALPLKRQFRDPYGDWWDKQERRNYGEPVHEDNDILGIFAPEAYTHFTPGWGGVLMGCFVGTVSILLLTVRQYYPDRPSVPKVYPGGLDTELGGAGGLHARGSEKTADEATW